MCFDLPRLSTVSDSLSCLKLGRSEASCVTISCVFSLYFLDFSAFSCCVIACKYLIFVYSDQHTASRMLQLVYQQIMFQQIDCARLLLKCKETLNFDRDRVDLTLLFKTTQAAIFLEWFSLTFFCCYLMGYVLSPTLFMIYMNDLLVKLEKQGMLNQSIVLSVLSTNAHVVCIQIIIL